MTLETRECQTCGREIVFAEHERTRRRAPLEASPRGTFVIDPDGTYRTETPEDRRARRDTYANHYATCPQAKAWRSGEARR